MKTVLIVEDSQDYSSMLKFFLSQRGFNVLTAVDGNEGVQKALAGKPDLILMDVMLPDQDGAETVLKIKGQPSLAQVPVVFLTALASDADSGSRPLMVQGQTYPMISKLLDPEEILRKVRQYCK